MDFTNMYKDMKDDQGRFRTLSLFWEMRHQAGQHEPIFTTKDHDIEKDGKTYISLKKIYMSYDHIPEYEYDFALAVFGPSGWKHFNKLATSKGPVSDLIKEWREELDIKIKAEALRAMMIASKGDDAKGVQAAKYLADKGYTTKRGRPSKEEIARQTKIDAGAHKELEDDMKRLNLKVLQGTK